MITMDGRTEDELRRRVLRRKLREDGKGQDLSPGARSDFSAPIDMVIEELREMEAGR